MTDKITGLKLEEIIKFDSKKFSTCIVKYSGACGGDVFEKEITLEQALALYEVFYDSGLRNKEIKKVFLTCPKEFILYTESENPYISSVANHSEYDLIRA